MMELVILLKVIFSLVIVVSMLFVLSYLLKNYLPRFSHNGKFDDIKIRDVKFLGKDRGLATIEFDERVFLISFDSNRIEKISEKRLTENSDGNL